MKKILLITFLLAPTFASASPYIGLNMGVKAWHQNQQFLFDPNKKKQAAQFNVTHHQEKMTSHIEPIFGFLSSNKDSYQAVEVHIVPLTQQQQLITNNNLNMILKQRLTGGLRFKTGFTKLDVSYYVIAGLSGVWQKIQTTFSDRGIYRTLPTYLKNYSANELHITPSIGAGAKYHLTKRMAMHLEYLYYHYTTRHYRLNHQRITFINPIGHHTAKFNNQTFQIGFSVDLI